MSGTPLFDMVKLELDMADMPSGRCAIEQNSFGDFRITLPKVAFTVGAKTKLPESLIGVLNVVVKLRAPVVGRPTMLEDREISLLDIMSFLRNRVYNVNSYNFKPNRKCQVNKWLGNLSRNAALSELWLVEVLLNLYVISGCSDSSIPKMDETNKKIFSNLLIAAHAKYKRIHGQTA